MSWQCRQIFRNYSRNCNWKNKSWKFSISATTRSLRDNEKDGVDYIQMSNEKFEHCVKFGDFLEWESDTIGETQKNVKVVNVTYSFSNKIYNINNLSKCKFFVL